MTIMDPLTEGAKWHQTTCVKQCVLKANAAKYNSHTQPFVQVLVEGLLRASGNKTKKMPGFIMELRVQQRGL